MSSLKDWLYKKKITITGSNGAGVGYSILLKVGESSGALGYDFHLEEHSASFPTDKNDGGDLRFTDDDKTTLLPFWVEKVEGVSPNRVAYIWIKVADNLDTDQDIYCYYGNSDATNISNGNNAFEFFDDFEGSFDSVKWSRSDLTDIYIDSGIMELHQNTTDKSTWLKSNIDLPNNLAIESKMQVHAGTNYSGAFRIQDVGFSQTYAGVRYDYYNHDDSSCMYSNYDSFYPLPCVEGIKLSPFWDTIWFRQSLGYEGDTGKIKLVRNKGDGDEVIAHTGPVCNESTRLYFNPYGWWTGHYIYIDWVGVRKYTDSEPTFGSVSIELLNGEQPVSKTLSYVVSGEGVYLRGGIVFDGEAVCQICFEIDGANTDWLNNYYTGDIVKQFKKIDYLTSHQYRVIVKNIAEIDYGDFITIPPLDFVDYAMRFYKNV